MILRIYKVLLLCLSTLCCNLLNAQEQETPVAGSWQSYNENLQSSEFKGLSWIGLGPVLNSGRIETIAVSPEEPGTIYAGFGSGNLWKTTNHGFTWKPLFDNMPAYSIGDVVLAPSDNNILYLGTGENLRARRGHTFRGAGVYRSDDAGETWECLGLENTGHIGRVAVHPLNPDIVLVAALGNFYSESDDRGVYRTVDGGKNWEKVLFTDNVTGANDVVFAPSDPSVVYASTWQCANAVSGAGSAVYKSTDSGKTWTRITGGLPGGTGAGRTGLAVSYSNADKVYALTDNLNRPVDKGTCELYRSDNGGTTWEKTHKEELKIFSSFGHVFTDCFINPQNDEELYLLGVIVLRTNDGGKSFEPLRGEVQHFFPSPAGFFHLDHHDMWVNPLNPGHLIAGNDGGLYISYDRGEHWFHYNNIPVGEFYFVRTDKQEPYNIYAGTQDDAAVMGPAKELKPGVSDGWQYVWIDPWAGGDGIVTAPDPVDPRTVYYESQNGAIRRKNMETGESVSIRPDLPEGSEGTVTHEWLTPFFVSEYDHKTLFYGSNYLFMTRDRGDSWETVSPDLSESAFEERCGGGLTAITQSPYNENLLYGGTANGAMWVSRDKGGSWDEISEGLPVQYVKSIAASRYNEKRVYAVLNGIKKDDFTASVYISDNYGKKWRKISSNLPESPVNVIVEDPAFENVLYAGTFNGVFVSVDNGDSWKVFGSGIPHCFIADMTIQEREMDLIAATHGRGIFKMNLGAFHKMMRSNVKEAAIIHFTDVVSSHRESDISVPANMSSVLDVTIYTPGRDNVRFSIGSKEGEVYYSEIRSCERGLNSFRWDLFVREISDNEPYSYNFNEYLEPGNYTLRVQGSDFSLEREIKVSAAAY